MGRIERFCAKHLQHKYFWVEPVVIPAVTLGVHLHLAPPHLHLDLHVPLVIFFIGNHGLMDVEDGHTGAEYECRQEPA